MHFCLGWVEILMTPLLPRYYFKGLRYDSKQGSLAKPLYFCRHYHLTHTSLLCFCVSQWIFIQINNFFKLPAPGIEPLTLGLQGQCSTPTPRGLSEFFTLNTKEPNMKINTYFNVSSSVSFYIFSALNIFQLYPTLPRYYSNDLRYYHCSLSCK